jgi:transposase-like protein
MAKYSNKIVKRICNLIKANSYTIAELCANVGISESCYYHWQETIVEFGEAIARARDQFDEILVKEAKNSLRKKVNGYEVDEKKTVFINGIDGKPVIKEQTTIKKHFQPDTSAIVFALTNKVPKEYKNKMDAELSGKDGRDLIPARILTKKEVQEYLKKTEDEF